MRTGSFGAGSLTPVTVYSQLGGRRRQEQEATGAGGNKSMRSMTSKIRSRREINRSRSKGNKVP